MTCGCWRLSYFVLWQNDYDKNSVIVLIRIAIMVTQHGLATRLKPIIPLFNCVSDLPVVIVSVLCLLPYFLCLDSPRVSIAEQNLIVLRSQPFTLTCQMALNPFYTELQWFRGSDIISGANTATYTMTGLESDNQFSCLVRNALGTGRGSTSVSVHCKLTTPRFIAFCKSCERRQFSGY